MAGHRPCGNHVRFLSCLSVGVFSVTVGAVGDRTEVEWVAHQVLSQAVVLSVVRVR